MPTRNIPDPGSFPLVRREAIPSLLIQHGPATLLLRGRTTGRGALYFCEGAYGPDPAWIADTGSMSGHTLVTRRNAWSVSEGRAINSYNLRSHSSAVVLAMWRIHRPAYVRAWEQYIASLPRPQRTVRQEWARLVI